MPQPAPSGQQSRSLNERLRRVVMTRIWGMNIHPSARIAPSALIDRTWPRGVHIGRDCWIDEEAVVLTHDRTRALYLDTRIGDRTFIGARAIILPGVTIGTDCVIDPGALVRTDVPDGSTAGGNPAKIVAREPATLNVAC